MTTIASQLRHLPTRSGAARLVGTAALLLLACLAGGSREAQAQQWYGAADSNIQYFGRVRIRPDGAPNGKNGAALNYAGSGFNIKFTGTSVSLMLTGLAKQFDNGPEGKPIDFVAVVDGNENGKVRFSVTDNYYKWYTVASGLPDGTHTLTVRRVADTQVQVTLTGLTVDTGRVLQAPAALPSRRIEFYGDSVTSGGSVEPIVANPNPDYDGDYRHNNDLTYGAVTARNLNADPRWISQGGVGLERGFHFVPLRDFWNLWDYDGFYRDSDPAVAYNFSLWTPRIVVVAIGHNDRQRGLDRATWVSRYATFINNLKNTYPNADIVCMNTKISDPSDGWWDAAIDPLVSAGSRVHKLRFGVQNHSGHPHIEDHREMASGLTAKIQEITGWSAGAPIGRRIGLRAQNNGYYVSANVNWNGYLQAGWSTGVGGWEQFDVVDAGNGDVALRSVQTGKFVTADLNQTSKQLRADWATQIQGWERFRWEPQSDGTIALKCVANGLYVTCNTNESGLLQARWAGSVGSWERFTFTDLGGF